jgi:DNA ligase-1
MFIAPMLLDRKDDPFNDDQYIFEPKMDGHRLIVSHIDFQIRLYTRNNNEVTRQYPELLKVPTDHDVVLDGEVCCMNPDTGHIDFESVTERFMIKKETKIRDAVKNQSVHYIVFDILMLDGQDLRHLPLMDRKAILARVLADNDYFSKINPVEGRGEDLFRVIQEQRMEGIVAKKKSSIYVSERSANWIKVINYQYTDVLIAGYKKKQFGWIAHVETENGTRHAGLIELAVPPSHKQALYAVSQPLIIGEDKHFVYLEPRIKARVKFRNWTHHGLLRSPSFVDFVV